MLKPRQGEDRAHLDLTTMGVSDEEARLWIEAQRPEGEDEGADQRGPFSVWPENWEALGLFLRLQTQWLRDSWGKRLGLRYEAMHAAMQMAGLKRDARARLFDQLVEMEQAAVEVLHGV